VDLRACAAADKAHKALLNVLRYFLRLRKCANMDILNPWQSTI
jgi:hypothetical protein